MIGLRWIRGRGSPDPDRPLRRLLSRQAQILHDAALADDGTVPRRELVRLERLARLERIHATLRPRHAPPRWPVALILLATLMVISALMFARVRETEIELHVRASELGFTMSKPQRLIEATVLSSLGAAGVRQVLMPDAVADSKPDRATAIRLAVVDPAEPSNAAPYTPPGSITLGVLVPPAGTEVRVAGNGGPGQYRLSLRHAPIPIDVSVQGAIRVGQSGAPARTVAYDVPRSVTIHPEVEGVDLDLGYASVPRGVFSTALDVEGLVLQRIREDTDGDRTIVRTSSTVLDGSVYFESLDGREYALRSAEGLRFASAVGEVRSLQLVESGLELTFRGLVKGMTIGTEFRRRSLMPTYLEWLASNHGLSLLWGATLYVSGLVFGVMRWLKGPA
jgi:hypothetical protein